ncbi:MAG TPA: glycosyltransferase family 2 protein [Gemmatimonadaceae bacterium]|nr:glycosyltransferase family 2 protein [Gemmatimonadaceae bacterium]
MTADSDPELSIVMPCLNERDTLESCIRGAQRALAENGIPGEIVVADNGSTDGSQEIAARLGARVVPVGHKGYGSALMGGIAAAHGKYILMGDTDDSYDFAEVPRFLAKLRDGYELVQGCRLQSGGGTVQAGAMPLLHRLWGNPMFSAMARTWFRAPIHDVHCGMRAFTKELYERLDQQCTGMEFASENIIKASLLGARMTEVPITLRRDGRVSHPPHLKTFRDGWRHLRFYLMYSPRWLFLQPGVLLILLGLLGYAVALPGLRISGINFDVHTLLFASLAIICGYQSVLFAVMTKIFAISQGLLPEDRRMTRLFEIVNLERGLIAGAILMLIGLAFLAIAVAEWYGRHFGNLDYERTMRWVIPGVTLTALGFQTVLSSFFFSILGMKRR